MNERETNQPRRDAREKYWNEDYVRYWKARVEEANRDGAEVSSVVTGDAKTSADRLYLDAIGLLQIGKADNVLELGCGFGRSLPALSRVAAQVAAVDISEEMIRAAKGACKENNVAFHVSPSENLPFPDESFDVIVCFAAFDAMYQTEALIEMNRVGKSGARVLLTGKNDDYHDDDTAALDAEAGARRKHHPNYFTDVRKLVPNLDRFGFEAEIQKYYLRRGDFSNAISCEARPERFYEYLLVLKKTGECAASRDFAISREVSRTCARQENPA